MCLFVCLGGKKGLEIDMGCLQDQSDQSQEEFSCITG